MERYSGMDVHAANCTLAVISEQGRKLKVFHVGALWSRGSKPSSELLYSVAARVVQAEFQSAALLYNLSTR